MSKKYSSYQAAAQAFERQSDVLLRPTEWNQNPVLPSWSIVNGRGETQPGRPIRQGDVLKIASPLNTTVHYVRVEHIVRKPDNLQFTVRPTNDPRYPATETIHFFTREATRTFTLQRDKNDVIFSTQGRNEKLNSGDEGGIFWAANLVSGGIIMNGGGDAYWSRFGNDLLNR